MGSSKRGTALLSGGGLLGAFLHKARGKWRGEKRGRGEEENREGNRGEGGGEEAGNVLDTCIVMHYSMSCPDVKQAAQLASTTAHHCKKAAVSYCLVLVTEPIG